MATGGYSGKGVGSNGEGYGEDDEEEMAAQAGGETGKVCRKRYAGKG